MNFKHLTISMAPFWCTLVSGNSVAGVCEEKYPVEKIIKEQIIETPYELTVKVPYEVAYFVTVKVPYNITETCIKKVAKDIWKKPWKLTTIWIDVHYECTRTAFREVREERFRTEYRDNVEKKIKRTVKKLEEYKRPAKYAECLTEKVVHDGRDLAIELITGEDPDEVRAEIHRMFAECQSRTADLDKLEKYIRAEENFARNGGHFETFMPAVAALAISSADAYAIGATAFTYGLYYGIDTKMKNLKKEYEATVKLCEEGYRKKVEEIETLVNTTQRKIAVNRSKIIAKISKLQNEIENEVREVNKKFKTAIEAYLNKKVENKNLPELLEDYSYLIQEDIDMLDTHIKNKLETISLLNEVLENPETILHYEEK